MTKERQVRSTEEALKLALEALEIEQAALAYEHGKVEHIENAITAVKEVLAQPEHEFVRGECVKCGASIEKQRPAAWVSEIAEEAELMLEKPRFRAVALYTTPPQRKEPEQEQEQEPVAWVVYSSAENDIVWTDKGKRLKQNTPLYTTPPQRTWVGLTDEERENCIASTAFNFAPVDIARAIEAKLKEKNK